MAEHPPTHYQRLGVSPLAGDVAVREAYLRLARLLHPDRLDAANEAERRLAERRMREVNEAWRVLKDPARRRDYDRQLTASGVLGGGGPDPRGGARRDTGSGAGPRRSPGPGRTTAGDPDVGLDPDDLPAEDGYHVPFFLSRLPLVLLGLIAAVIFVFSAYAKQPTDPTSGGTPTTVCRDPVTAAPC